LRSRPTLQCFATRFPEPAVSHLDRRQDFEAQAPDPFAGMYQLGESKSPHILTDAAPEVCLSLQRLLIWLLRGWRTCRSLSLGLLSGGVNVLLG
jgi:hypothetical protein